MHEKQLILWLIRGLGALALAALLAYPLDWAVWRVRVALGNGMGSVAVSQFTVAELKGSKESYYLDGTTTVACSRSLLPEAGSGACWWLQRHAEVLRRY